MADQPTKKNKENTSTFTIDREGSSLVDMPSVTRLLNRKSLSKKAPSLTPEKPFVPESLSNPNPPPEPKSKYDAPSPISPVSSPASEPVSENDRTVISVSTEQPSEEFVIQSSHMAAGATQENPPAPSAPLKIQPAQRRANKESKNLIIWEPRILKAGADPLGQGIALLLEKGALNALFLAIQPPPAGSPVPIFVSTAAVQPRNKLNIWTGMKWDPAMIPEMWNHFIKVGSIELSPPGTKTNQNSNRNIIRTAFGILPNEWLLLVRAGPATACRGVVAFVSQKSLLTDLNSASSLLFSSAPKAA